MEIKKRCNRCLKPMRNIGSEENPEWVCDNSSCVKYVPPTKQENKD